MNLEKFLEFWTQNNRLIIELTFGFIFVLILFLIYRQFFSHETAQTEGTGTTSLNINTAEIEEKLQKIMESQLNFKGQLGNIEASSHPVAPATSATADAPAADIGPLKKELEALKEQLKSKDVKIDELTKAGAAAAAGAPAAAAVGSAPSPELEAKIKELEGRLQEYEIISEDIADLSFYKEENARIQKELADLKAGKPSVEAAKPAAPAPTPEPTPVAVAPEVTPAATPAPKEPEPAPEVAAPAAAVATDAVNGPVDDDIMKEFAAAIADQKKTSVEPAKELDGEKLKESQQLMGDFENFLKKG